MPTRLTSPSVNRPSASGWKNPELDKALQLLDAGPGSLGRDRDLVSLHAPYCTGGVSDGAEAPG